jgi:hypothetical protein
VPVIERRNKPLLKIVQVLPQCVQRLKCTYKNTRYLMTVVTGVIPFKKEHVSLLDKQF